VKLELLINRSHPILPLSFRHCVFLFIFSLEVLVENTSEGAETTSQNIESLFSKDPIVETVTTVEDIEPLVLDDAVLSLTLSLSLCETESFGSEKAQRRNEKLTFRSANCLRRAYM
jgi:hypothetical protein